jgi:hypothetical protein
MRLKACNGHEAVRHIIGRPDGGPMLPKACTGHEGGAGVYLAVEQLLDGPHGGRSTSPGDRPR